MPLNVKREIGMIEIKELRKKYKNHEVLNIESLQFQPGKSYGLVGHNGAGKTTLFKCMTNIICNYTGSIIIDGISVKEQNDILKNVGIVLDGMSVYGNQTGWFNIHYFSGLRGIENDERAIELARELDILAALDDKVKNYSYGMQKKLILLIALMYDPKILILDEPFRGLDIDSVKWFKKYLKQLTHNGLTLLISSHVQNDLEALCEEVFVINKGSIVDRIDMTAEKKKLTRIVDTTNNELLLQLLEKENLAYELTEDRQVKLDIGDSKWTVISANLKEANIEITELSKVKVLEDKLN